MFLFLSYEKQNVCLESLSHLLSSLPLPPLLHFLKNETNVLTRKNAVKLKRNQNFFLLVTHPEETFISFNVTYLLKERFPENILYLKKKHFKRRDTFYLSLTTHLGKPEPLFLFIWSNIRATKPLCVLRISYNIRNDRKTLKRNTCFSI